MIRTYLMGSDLELLMDNPKFYTPIVELLKTHNFVSATAAAHIQPGIYGVQDKPLEFNLIIDFKQMTYYYVHSSDAPPIITYEEVVTWLKENPHRVASKKFGL